MNKVILINDKNCFNAICGFDSGFLYTYLKNHKEFNDIKRDYIYIQTKKFLIKIMGINLQNLLDNIKIATNIYLNVNKETISTIVDNKLIVFDEFIDYISITEKVEVEIQEDSDNGKQKLKDYFNKIGF